MKLKIYIEGYGAEITVGKCSKEIYKYVQDKFDGDADAYASAIDDGEVDSEFQIVGDMTEFCDCDDLAHEYGPGLDAYISVEKDEGGWIVESEDIDDYTELRNTNSIKLKRGEHAFIWRSVEKGYWREYDLTVKKFDKSKLKVQYDKIQIGDDSYEVVAAVLYDGVELEDKDVLSTDGKSFELELI